MSSTAAHPRAAKQGRFRGPSGIAEALSGLGSAAFCIAGLVHVSGSWLLVPAFALAILFAFLARRNLRERQQEAPSTSEAEQEGA